MNNIDKWAHATAKNDSDSGKLPIDFRFNLRPNPKISKQAADTVVRTSPAIGRIVCPRVRQPAASQPADARRGNRARRQQHLDLEPADLARDSRSRPRRPPPSPTIETMKIRRNHLVRSRAHSSELRSASELQGLLAVGLLAARHVLLVRHRQQKRLQPAPASAARCRSRAANRHDRQTAPPPPRIDNPPRQRFAHFRQLGQLRPVGRVDIDQVLRRRAARPDRSRSTRPRCPPMHEPIHAHAHERKQHQRRHGRLIHPPQQWTRLLIVCEFSYRSLGRHRLSSRRNPPIGYYCDGR